MSRTYRDPIHKEIFLDSKDPVEKLIIELIDSREIQRLRWIRQLGTGWFTFHGAEASRFQHSLGAMHVGKLMLEKVCQDLDLNEETFQEYKALVLSAALLHDVGHGPFSHSSEDINHVKHEVWTKKIIESPNSEVNHILEKYSPGFAGKVISLLNKTYPVKFLSNLVNSQIDCDRFDYLIRDSYYTGANYGQFDLGRIISSLKVNQEKDCIVVSGEKGMLAVEDYLYSRYSMYLQIYQHKKCLASDSHLLKLFNRAKWLIQTKRIAFIEEHLLLWISNPEKMVLKDFLQVDDICVLNHIKHWIYEKDPILKDLAKRFFERKLFKAERISPGADFKALYENKATELKKRNLDPTYYLDVVTIASNPYSFYNPNTSDFSKAIFVDYGDGTLKEISTVSHIVNSLVKDDFENSWLIYVPIE